MLSYQQQVVSDSKVILPIEVIMAQMAIIGHPLTPKAIMDTISIVSILQEGHFQKLLYTKVVKD